MRFKRRRNLEGPVQCGIQTLGIGYLLTFLISAILFGRSTASATNLIRIHSELILVGAGLVYASAPVQQDAPIFFATNETLTPYLHQSSSLTNFTLQANNSTSNDVHPRRLTQLPNTRSNLYKRNSRLQAPGSALNRARLLLGSLNRQNCFVRVLCGLGAREPTTKTDLLNDYVYLMEELLIDDDEDDPKPNSKTKTKTWGKNKKKVHTKKDKDDSDSSMSKSEENDEDGTKNGKTEDIDDKLVDWNFLADQSLAQDDPQVLKYVKLEEKRRLHKDKLPNDVLLQRSGKEIMKNDTKRTETEEPIPLQLPPKSTLRLARKMAEAVKAGKTFFGSRRQCRTFSREKCPFDDIQMNEIVTNLKKMLIGPGQAVSSASKTTTTVTATGAADGQIKAITQPQGAGSKVEIVLHLNQNGMPYGGYPMPMQFHPPVQAQVVSPGSTNDITSKNATNGLAPPHPPWPQLQLGGSSDPRYPMGHPMGHPGMSYLHPQYYPTATPTAPITSTANAITTTSTTARSAGEEQLLDFLYGVVNFNETETEAAETAEIGRPSDIPATKQQNPASSNPYWSAAHTALDKVDDVEHQLKIRDRDSDQDDDSKSKSSEEEELKLYIKSLKETLQGIAEMNNGTLMGKPKEVKKSSEEHQDEDGSSQEDFYIPNFDGVNDDKNYDDDEDDDEEQEESGEGNSPPQQQNSLNPTPEPEKNKSSTSRPPPLKLFVLSTTRRPSTTQKPTRKVTTTTVRPHEQLFDEDNEDNNSAVVQKLFGRENQKQQTGNEDDEYEPQYSSNSDEDDDAEDEENDDEESEEPEHKSSPIPPASSKNLPKRPTILLKFEPMKVQNDHEEMSNKDRKKLIALSNVLLPQVPDTLASTPNRQPVKDIVEEIRIPTAKPVLTMFESVSTIGKNKIINIDEFADDSGTTPTFPKRKKLKKGKQPTRMRYQTRRKPPMRRPIRPAKDQHKYRHSNSDSSDEGDQSRDTSSQLSRGDLNYNSGEIIGNGTKSKNGHSSNKRPLISVPLHLHHPFPPSGQVHQSPDFYDSLMNYMGLKKVGKHLPPPHSVEIYSQSKFHYGYGSKDEEIMDRGKSDLPITSDSLTYLKPQPKIGIKIPVGIDIPQNRDAVQRDEDEGKKKDKKKGKKKKGGKKKKKKKKKDKGSSGYAMQFHQQVYPAPAHEPGLWDKIKGFVDTLASKQNEAGETPFIHVGFSETDPLDGNPHSVIQDKGPVESHIVHSGGGSGYGGGDSDEDTAEEEEDDLADDEDRSAPSQHREEDDLPPVSGPEYEGIDYDENDDEESNESSEVSSSPPVTISSPITTQTTEKLMPSSVSTLTSGTPSAIPTPLTRKEDETPSPPTSPPPTTKKTTIAPKPPKYILNRQQLKIKKKQKKQQQKVNNSTVAPPIMLFVTTTIPPSTTITSPQTTPPSVTKLPKRRIIYKPPGKRVNINVSPGTSLIDPAFTTTTPKPSTSSLKSMPEDWIKTRVEDDEVEPPSHFFQPGPNGWNVRGRPPIPIDAFHIQSEDMLIDTDEDEKLRGGIRRRPGPHRPPPSSPFFAHPYGIQSDSSSNEGSDEGSSPDGMPSSAVLIATPRPRPIQIHHESNTPSNPEEMRGTRVKTKHHNRMKFRPHRIHQASSNQYNNNGNHQHREESEVTSSVMSSPIFSNYFKHLYTSFGQYLPTG